MHERLLAVPYNLKSPNGVSCTLATLAAAALGVRDLQPSRPSSAARSGRRTC
jgi:hypothetical protein